MKRFAFLLVLFCSGAKLSYAAQDMAGNLYITPAAWRSSTTCSADSMIAIATIAYVNFGGVIITSTGSDPSSVGIFDGSFNRVITTITINDGKAGPYPYGQGIRISSGGLRYSNVGASCLTILWQYKNDIVAGH